MNELETSSLPPSNLSQIEVGEYLTVIKGPNPCGESLRYDPLYDQIRNARREDDATLSRGIWQYDLKRADWFTVEKLASEALMNHSKDLQIAGWLGEAWIMIYGIPGLIENLRLLRLLCEKFWTKLYPLLEEEDTEFRSQFFDWYDQTMMKHLVKIPIIGNDLANKSITLADWRSAFRFDSVIKREPDSNRLIQKAVERGQITLKQFYTFIKILSTSVVKERLQELDTLYAEFNALKKTLDRLMANSTMAFNELKPTLDDLKRIYQTELEQRPDEEEIEKAKEEAGKPALLQAESKESTHTPPSTSSESSSTSPPPNQEDIREQAYQQLSEIMMFLQKTDPHSPAPRLLHQILAWKDQNITQILSELGASPEELIVLMKFLGLVQGSQDSKEKNTSSESFSKSPEPLQSIEA